MQPSNQTSIMSNIKVDHVILGPFYVHFPTTKCAAPQGTVWRFSSAMESFLLCERIPGLGVGDMMHNHSVTVLHWSTGGGNAPGCAIKGRKQGQC